MNSSIEKHKKNRKLTTLVENKTTYSADFAELNLYETHAIAKAVKLTFNFPVIASMLTGKKVMQVAGLPKFNFYPGESVVMPSHKATVIDFPEASLKTPTQCLALGIDSDKVVEVVDKFNNAVAIEKENNSWNLDASASHLIHNKEIDVLLQRLLQTFLSPTISKDVLLDLMVQELIVRLLQTKAKSFFLTQSDSSFSDSRIGSVIRYIKEHLTDKSITVETLAKKAYMSSSHFHKQFKNTLGISPIDYINSEKIKFAKKLMKENKAYRISEIAYLSGFNSISYFNRQFKKLELMTPQQFKNSL